MYVHVTGATPPAASNHYKGWSPDQPAPISPSNPRGPRPSPRPHSSDHRPQATGLGTNAPPQAPCPRPRSQPQALEGAKAHGLEDHVVWIYARTDGLEDHVFWTPSKQRPFFTMCKMPPPKQDHFYTSFFSTKILPTICIPLLYHLVQGK